METTLKKLFDYQRFEDNSRLKAICDSVEEKYAQMEELSDDDLYMVAAGRSDSGLARKKKGIEIITDTGEKQ